MREATKETKSRECGSIIYNDAAAVLIREFSLLTFPSPNLKKLYVLPQRIMPQCERVWGGLLVRILVKKRLVIQYSSTISNDKQTDDLFAYLIS